MDRELLYHL